AAAEDAAESAMGDAGDACRGGDAALVPLPAGGCACPTAERQDTRDPGVDCRPSCPAQSGGNARPRGALCQVLVGPSYGGPHRADPALGLGRYRTGPEALAGARLGFDPELSARGLEHPLRRL